MQQVRRNTLHAASLRLLGWLIPCILIHTSGALDTDTCPHWGSSTDCCLSGQGACGWCGLRFDTGQCQALAFKANCTKYWDTVDCISHTSSSTCYAYSATHGCGWCGVDATSKGGTCLMGDSTGPSGQTCASHWDTSDCISQTSSAACAAYVQAGHSCGWCGKSSTEGVCMMASQKAQCDKTWDTQDCMSQKSAYSCHQFRVEQGRQCGWCGDVSTGTCLTGDTERPLFTDCDVNTRVWDTSGCVFRNSPSACTAAVTGGECGWCGTNDVGICVPGSRTPDTIGPHPWAYNACNNFDAEGCAVNTNQADCDKYRQTHYCGWCGNSGFFAHHCLAGISVGTFPDAAKCSTPVWVGTTWPNAALASVSPRMVGREDGLVTLTLTGSNLGLDAVDALPYLYLADGNQKINCLVSRYESPSRLSCVVSISDQTTPGTVFDVKIRNMIGDGTSTLTLTVYDVPIVDNINPTNGVIEGGTIVNIYGRGFGSSAQDIVSVTAAGVRCGSMQYISPTHIVCTTGAATNGGTGAVIVDTGAPNGGPGRSNAAFTYADPSSAVTVPPAAVAVLCILAVMLLGVLGVVLYRKYQLKIARQRYARGEEGTALITRS